MGRCALFVVGLLLGVALLAPTPAFAIIPIQLDQDWNLRADGGSNSEKILWKVWERSSKRATSQLKSEVESTWKST